MLRLTEIQLPLDHPEADLTAAILARLGIDATQLKRVELFRRSYDARKKSAIVLTYSVDVEVDDEAAVLRKHQGKPHVAPTPDTSYKYVTHASAVPEKRPVVIGTGPCGIFAGLILAQMGFCPIILERGKIVRERTKDDLGAGGANANCTRNRTCSSAKAVPVRFRMASCIAKSKIPSITAARC